MTLFIPRSLRRGAAGYFSGEGRGIFPEYPAAEWKFPFFQNGSLSADANKPPPTSSVRCFASSLTLLSIKKSTARVLFLWMVPRGGMEIPVFQNGPLSADANKPPPTSSVRCFASSLMFLYPEAEWKFPFFQNGPLSADASKPPPASSVRCFASSLMFFMPDGGMEIPIFSKRVPFR